MGCGGSKKAEKRVGESTPLLQEEEFNTLEYNIPNDVFQSPEIEKQRRDSFVIDLNLEDEIDKTNIGGSPAVKQAPRAVDYGTDETQTKAEPTVEDTDGETIINLNDFEDLKNYTVPYQKGTQLSEESITQINHDNHMLLSEAEESVRDHHEELLANLQAPLSNDIVTSAAPPYSDELDDHLDNKANSPYIDTEPHEVPHHDVPDTGLNETSAHSEEEEKNINDKSAVENETEQKVPSELIIPQTPSKDIEVDKNLGDGILEDEDEDEFSGDGVDEPSPENKPLEDNLSSSSEEEQDDQIGRGRALSAVKLIEKFDKLDDAVPLVPSNFGRGNLVVSSSSSDESDGEGDDDDNEDPSFNALEMKLSHDDAPPEPEQTEEERLKAIAASSKKATALYDFVARDESELSFKRGDILSVIEGGAEDQMWYGEFNGATGYFPKSYCKLVRQEIHLDTAKRTNKILELQKQCGFDKKK
eukprot:TRINITY_DN5926_c0_g1_i1.p1 TRINITY_DN5926_c0_g1~~TRINITY_DN5926_c0_g1_i1.p1  ORF type:complete len:473 (-),score=135.02 TRINITY_DN5926_c0_g1_i1:28-1446(-)